jgi:hypothetical protein
MKAVYAVAFAIAWLLTPGSSVMTVAYILYRSSSAKRISAADLIIAEAIRKVEAGRLEEIETQYVVDPQGGVRPIATGTRYVN